MSDALIIFGLPFAYVLAVGLLVFVVCLVPGRDRNSENESAITRSTPIATSPPAEVYVMDRIAELIERLLSDGLVVRSDLPVETDGLRGAPSISTGLDVEVDESGKVVIERLVGETLLGALRSVEGVHCGSWADQDALKVSVDDEADPDRVPALSGGEDDLLPDADDDRRRLDGDSVNGDAAVSRHAHGSPSVGAGSHPAGPIVGDVPGGDPSPTPGTPSGERAS